jgi:S1-C subfamily serine protease
MQVWDTLGHIVTAYAPISQLLKKGGVPLSIMVVSPDGSMAAYPVSVSAKDPSHELVVLQAQAPPDALVPLQLAPSSDLRVGQDAFLISVAGGEKGLSHVLSVGVVSAMGRAIPASNGQAMFDMLQVCAMCVVSVS